MNLRISDISPKECYSIFTQCIIPRPIAWVLSDNGNGSYNLAPFSYFNGLSTNPPLIYISVGKKQDGSPKDTHRNIEERDHFVLHIPTVAQANLVSDSAEHLDFGDSELDKLGLTTTHDEGMPLPRLRDAAIAFYCKTHQITPVGNTPQAIIIGEITDIYVHDSIISHTDGKLRIDPKTLNPLARLGGPYYAELGRVFGVERKD